VWRQGIHLDEGYQDDDLAKVANLELVSRVCTWTCVAFIPWSILDLTILFLLALADTYVQELQEVLEKNGGEISARAAFQRTKTLTGVRGGGSTLALLRWSLVVSS
jgi:hypothetical protein